MLSPDRENFGGIWSRIHRELMVFALEISILMRKMPKFSACGGLYSGKHHYFEESPPQAEKNWGV